LFAFAVFSDQLDRPGPLTRLQAQYEWQLRWRLGNSDARASFIDAVRNRGDERLATRAEFLAAAAALEPREAYGDGYTRATLHDATVPMIQTQTNALARYLGEDIPLGALDVITDTIATCPTLSIPARIRLLDHAEGSGAPRFHERNHPLVGLVKRRIAALCRSQAAVEVPPTASALRTRALALLDQAEMMGAGRSQVR